MNAQECWEDFAETSTAGDGQQQRPLPDLVDAADFVAKPIEVPNQLIHGLLYRGAKLAVGGGSKSYKTWSLLDMAFSVSHFEPYLSLKTNRAKVAFVNLELKDWSMQRRLVALANAKGRKIEKGWLQMWNLRGWSAPYYVLLPRLVETLKNHDYEAVFLDPSYKLLGKADENSASDIAAMLNMFESFSEELKASVVFSSHFAKGNAAAKESIDRISGSGVFARDPDSILTFTRHEEDGAFTIETTLRDLPPMKPFVVRWDCPLFRRDAALDPERLRQPNRGGRAKKYRPDMLLTVLGKRQMSTMEWQKRTCAETKMSASVFFDLKNELEAAGAITKNDEDQWRATS